MYVEGIQAVDKLTASLGIRHWATARSPMKILNEKTYF